MDLTQYLCEKLNDYQGDEVTKLKRNYEQL